MSDISPRVDIAFKKIFGVEENKDLLISLINSIVGEEDQVQEVTLLNPYNFQNHRNDKLSILDIKAKGIDGKRFNIEIQVIDEGDYDKRALYYWAKLYTEQLQLSKKGSKDSDKFVKDYSRLVKSIGIHILNFTSILGVDKYHNVFHVSEKETGFLYFTDLELHTIELQKFSKGGREDLADIVAKVKNSLDMWVAFLTRHDLLDADHLPSELDNSALRKAIHVLDVMNFGAEEREAYEGHLKWLMLEASALNKKFAEGRAEGEAKKAEKIARQMIRIGRPLEEICMLTELSKTVVQKLSHEVPEENKEAFYKSPQKSASRKKVPKKPVD